MNPGVAPYALVSDDDRDASVHLLQDGFADGRLTAGELERRLERALTAQSHDDLRAVVSDRAVDTGMVMRLAVLDIEHVTTLLAHLGELAAARGDEQLAGFCREWAAAMRPEVRAVRTAAVALGGDPDRAAASLDDSPLTRLAHRMGWVLGSIGEAFDRVAGSIRVSDKATPEERSAEDAFSEPKPAPRPPGPDPPA